MDKKRLFTELNNELEKEGITLEIICVGGFVLEFHHIRATQDVDAFFHETEKIKAIIRHVGDRFDANEPDELWLNNSVANLNRTPPREICEVVFRYPHLTVLMPPLDYILGMKLDSARERDTQDIATILRLLKTTSPTQVLSKLHAYGFHPDLSLLLEGFEKAYGVRWLAHYLTNHAHELPDA